MVDNAEPQVADRLKRAVAKAVMKRTVTIKRIKSIHALSKCTSPDSDLAGRILVATDDLDKLWLQFEMEDAEVLDGLVQMDKLNEYDADLQAQIFDMVCSAKAASVRLRPSVKTTGHKLGKEPQSYRSTSKLPDISLPSFNGDFNYWPTFRNQFSALVGRKTELSKIEKMYYLIGCLQGPAAEAIRGIPVSSNNYDLAWNTLATRFHRPQLIATSLIDKLLSAPVSSRETLHDLSKFIATFEENISLLKALEIPDLGSFMIFSIALRCLPLSTRMLFESYSSSEFPVISELLSFVQSRVAVLKIFGDRPKSNNSMKLFQPVGTSAQKKSSKFSPVALVSSKPSSSGIAICPCCSGCHLLGSCQQFESLSVEERNQLPRVRNLCYTCLSRDHLANMCQSKSRCDKCFGKHHTLLHSYLKRQKAGTSDGIMSLCTEVYCPELDNVVTVMLGTALVKIQDRYGKWQTARALIDSASQISAITESCSQRLGFQPTNWTSTIRGLCGIAVLDIRGLVTCTIRSRFANEPRLSTDAWVLESITCCMPRTSLPDSVKEVYANLALADPSFHIESPVDLLLGADLFPMIMTSRKLVLEKNLPTAFNSIFGWILIGPVFQSAVDWSFSPPVSLTASMESLIEKLCSIEEPIAAPLSFTVNDLCEEVFKDEHIQLSSGRTSVTLPICTAISQMRRENSIRRFDNPADYASRGILPSELPALSLYWNGPSVLRNYLDMWAGIPPQILACDLPETRSVSLVLHTPDKPEWFYTYSSYDRLVRIIVWMYRFINGCRKGYAGSYLDVLQENVGLATRRKLLDQYLQTFWRRWSSEYLTTIQASSKWTKTVPNIQINDMVVIIDKQLPPLMWRLGRVLDLLPGQDGVVRLVRILTSQGQFTRPIRELVVLPTQ